MLVFHWIWLDFMVILICYVIHFTMMQYYWDI